MEHYAKTQGIPFKELDTSALSAPSVGYIKTNGNHLTVYQGSASENASGYQFAIGKSADSGSKNQFYRKPNGVTDAAEGEMAFSYMPKGTYYVGMHAYNRTRPDKTKVFSRWSKAKKITVR